MYIDKCIDFLQSDNNFKDDWLLEFNFIEKKDDSIKDFIGKINESFNFVIENLNYSILSGEYVRIKDFKEKLDELFSSISNIQSSIEIEENEEVNLELTSIFVENFMIPYNLINRSMDRLLHTVNKKITNQSGRWLFSAEKSHNNFHNNFQLSGQIKELLTITLKNIRVAIIDLDFAIDEKILSSFIIDKKELEEISTDYKFLKILKDKYNYLIRKILYRIQQDKKYSYQYAFDYQDKELKIKEIPSGYFECFDSITKKHYIDLENNYTESEINLIKEKVNTNSDLKFIDIHHLTKVYKDKHSSHKLVSSLVEKFNTKYTTEINKEVISLFDKSALVIMKNYMLNNEFSIFLENKKITLDEIDEKLESIKSIQHETSIRNYFPFLKYSLFLVDRLNSEFKQKEFNYSQVCLLKEKFSEILKETYDCLEWCKDRNFLAFQLPSEECVQEVQFENGSINLFLSTSFVLPINYEKLQLELSELTRKEAKFQTLVEVNENLEVQKKSIYKLRESVEKNDRRSIEILGIFSAIVLFSSGSIQIFSIENLTMNDALTFMLVFAYSLVLFIFLIWLITRENIKELTIVHKLFFIGLSITSVLALFFVWNSNKSNQTLEKSIIHNTTISTKDSLVSRDTLNIIKITTKIP